ncbi:hypothetical protein [Lapidilactobacillus bayanensis]|uniref:hypothetical protein n=1 Tax=Lapidilactobacillus bayanensis TaxID=2485998 RepID=UPI000F7B8A11|nr:hypothetical protein [Lapidilactobacillus bayanensis]
MKKILTIASMALFFIGAASTSVASAATTDTQATTPVIDIVSKTDLPVITGRAAVASLPMWVEPNGKVHYATVSYLPPLSFEKFTNGDGITFYHYTTGNGTIFGEDYK